LLHFHAPASYRRSLRRGSKISTPAEFAAFFDNELRKFQRTAGLKAMD
jgi:hypothetical protein